MSIKVFLGAITLCSLLCSMKTDKPAYRIFDKNGKVADYRDLLKDASKADIVFFGELHNNPICHWLEYELAADLFEMKKNQLQLGAEMFESDNQLIVNEYLKGLIRDKNFEAEARLWPNYKTDYKPLLTFARDSGVLFVATNIPRRYASVVNKSGFEGLASLDTEAMGYIAPLPIAFDPELTWYKEMIRNMGDAAGHGTANIAKAQAVKDATMAYFIMKNHTPGKVFLHFNGSYHSDNFGGIVWYIRQANPKLRILTISTVEQSKLDDLDPKTKGIADYIIAIPETMTKTQP